MRERDLLNIVLVFWALHGLITKMKNKHSDPYLIQMYESNIFGTHKGSQNIFATCMYKFEKFMWDKLLLTQYSPSYHFKELIKAWIFFQFFLYQMKFFVPVFFVILSREKRWHIKSVK